MTLAVIDAGEPLRLEHNLLNDSVLRVWHVNHFLVLVVNFDFDVHRTQEFRARLDDAGYP